VCACLRQAVFVKMLPEMTADADKLCCSSSFWRQQQDHLAVGLSPTTMMVGTAQARMSCTQCILQLCSFKGRSNATENLQLTRVHYAPALYLIDGCYWLPDKPARQLLPLTESLQSVMSR
jgi:hypothetical protein